MIANKAAVLDIESAADQGMGGIHAHPEKHL